MTPEQLAAVPPSVRARTPEGWRAVEVNDPSSGHRLSIVGPSYRERRVGRWITFEFTEPDHLPHVTCCYIVLEPRLGAVYIGQTVNLRTRFKQHGFRFDNGLWVSRKRGIWRELIFKRRVVEKFGDWAMHERRLIRRLQPIHNPQCA